MCLRQADPAPLGPYESERRPHAESMIGVSVLQDTSRPSPDGASAPASWGIGATMKVQGCAASSPRGEDQTAPPAFGAAPTSVCPGPRRGRNYGARSRRSGTRVAGRPPDDTDRPGLRSHCRHRRQSRVTSSMLAVGRAGPAGGCHSSPGSRFPRRLPAPEGPRRQVDLGPGDAVTRRWLQRTGITRRRGDPARTTISSSASSGRPPTPARLPRRRRCAGRRCRSDARSTQTTRRCRHEQPRRIDIPSPLPAPGLRTALRDKGIRRRHTTPRWAAALIESHGRH